MPIIKMGREKESASIILNLIKDSGWCYGLGLISIITVIPVFTFQVYEIWKCRKEGTHKVVQNVMATMALSANITWMLSDLYLGERYRHYARWLFFIGILLLVVYGICLLFNKRTETTTIPQRVMTVSKTTRGLVFVHSTRPLDQPREMHHERHLMVRRRQPRARQ